MMLTPKETTLLQDLRKHEQLCVEKYEKYADTAHDPQLSGLFEQIAQIEQKHIGILDQIAAGSPPSPPQSKAQTRTYTPGNYSVSEKQLDQFLCNDALTMEKYMAADYNTSIFEFRDQKARCALNHIQTSAQEHGEKIYTFMSTNGMYH